jgi:hypothetical protein
MKRFWKSKPGSINRRAIKELSTPRASLIAEIKASDVATDGARSTCDTLLRPLRMKKSVYRAIRQAVGARRAEQGGALGGNRAAGEVTHFHFDEFAQITGVSYSPDVAVLNRLLAEEWNPAGINLMGFVHSHPPGFCRPSGGDIVYARAILKANPEMDRLLLPIIMAAPDAGRFEMFPFAALRGRDGVQIEPLQLLLVDDEEPSDTATRDNICGDEPLISARQKASPEETFRRVKDAYDLPQLAACRIIVVGTGGAAGFVEDMTRAGVGSLILIDPDTVSETNLATQQVYRRDIGRAKVEALAARIRDINPDAHVVALQRSLDDLDDHFVQELATARLEEHSPAQTLLCGFTDNFKAQARINRLALHLGLPSLCAQLYREGRAVEVTFTYPGLTPACHRCALGSRFRAYLEGGFVNNVTSDGTPIFATTRLNAIKGFIATAILHYGTDHPRWGGLLKLIADRNLIQVRLDPEVERTLGLDVFNRVFRHADLDRVLFDETVWLPQQPERPEYGFSVCPDCGGTGDLRRAIGTFADTRVMRR